MNLIKFNLKWILLLFVIFISGCAIMGYQFDIGGTSVVTGEDKSGLIMSFDSNRPPSGKVLTEGDSFQVAVNLKNTGERKINGELCISDPFLYRSYGGIPEPECTFATLGSAQYDSEPSETKIYFPSPDTSYSYYNLNSEFSQTSTISASFTYDVDSVSNAGFCVRGDIESQLPGKIICPDSETISGSSVNNMKAPIVVNSIEKNIVSGGGNARIRLDITLNKITNGEVLSILDYDISFADGTRFDCGTKSGQLLFDKNEKIIKCSANPNIGQDYVDQVLQVNLKYRFKRLISTQLEIEKGGI